MNPFFRTLFSPTLIVLLSVSACATGTVSLSQFKRIDTKIDGFTQHFEGTPFKITEKGLFSVELLITGNKFKAGKNDFMLILHDRNDRDVADAKIDAVYQGSGDPIKIVPRAVSDIPGLYSADGLTLSASDRGEMIVRISSGGISDSVVFYFTT